MAITRPPLSPFLDLLPPELRLTIYEHLLVTPFPLKGPSARLNQRYNLHTSILRVNKQIHAEARSIFFGKNTFYITSSIPEARDGPAQDDEGSGAFEPPLQLACLPLVRHLSMDLLYCPAPAPARTPLHTTTARTRSRSTCDAAEYFRTGGEPRATGAKRREKNQAPRCIGAERYVTSLSYVLNAVAGTLLSLKLCADVRRYTSTVISSQSVVHKPATNNYLEVDIDGDDNDGEEDDLDSYLSPSALLTGPHAADTSLWFKAALANLSTLPIISLRYDFPESYFDFLVERTLLVKGSLVFLTGQVLFARSEIRLRALMEELGEEEAGEGEGAEQGFTVVDGEEEEEQEVGERDGPVDLAGQVPVGWPGKVVLGVEGLGARVVEGGRKASC